MCLIGALYRVHRDVDLVIAANRDELFARPAGPMQVLSPAGPRILGGRDLLASGTWLAVNEHGVVAGVTNQPLAARSPRGGTLPPGARDLTKRTRGELPLMLARHSSAEAAVEAFASLRPDDYNPCALLVGDARALFYVSMLGGEHPEIEALGSGVHVLENRELHADSPKARFVKRQLDGLVELPTPALVPRLEALLASREVPPDAEALRKPEDFRPVEVEAPRVVAGPYGTRSAAIILVRGGELPRVRYSDVPPGEAPFADADALWGGG